MALSSGSADSLATAICTSLSITDSSTQAKWKTICETIYTHLKSDISIVIAASSIAVTTTGSATAQSGTGPTLPVSISPQ